MSRCARRSERLTAVSELTVGRSARGHHPTDRNVVLRCDAKPKISRPPLNRVATCQFNCRGISPPVSAAAAADELPLTASGLRYALLNERIANAPTTKLAVYRRDEWLGVASIEMASRLPHKYCP